MRMRWKLMLTSLLLVFIPVYILNDYAVRAFNRFTSQDLEAGMVAQAHMLGAFYGYLLKHPGSDNTEVLTSALRTCEENTQSHVQLLSPSGDLLCETTRGEPINPTTCPEVEEAIAGRRKARWTLTPDHKQVVYYVAVPIRQDGTMIAIIHVTHDTVDITHAILAMVHNQRVALAITLGMATLISTLLSLSITRRLSRLARGAVAVARGEPDALVPTDGTDEIGELGRAVKHMKEEIEQRNQYNREFISTTMHELKMPLTAIKGAAELLEQGAADKKESRDKFIGNIRYEADRVIRMVWELGELTRLDTESLHAAKVETDYGVFVREAVERLQLTLDEKHPAIRISAPERKFMLKIIPGRIEQVLGNLIENALRYTPASGAIDVVVEAAPDGSVMTTVRDTGCGISAGNLPHVFERFFTTEPKDKPKDYGSGLGLAVAKSIIEHHQGRIWVEANRDQGAMFCFTLPMT